MASLSDLLVDSSDDESPKELGLSSSIAEILAEDDDVAARDDSVTERAQVGVFVSAPRAKLLDLLDDDPPSDPAAAAPPPPPRPAHAGGGVVSNGESP